MLRLIALMWILAIPGRVDCFYNRNPVTNHKPQQHLVCACLLLIKLYAAGLAVSFHTTQKDLDSSADCHLVLDHGLLRSNGVSNWPRGRLSHCFHRSQERHIRVWLQLGAPYLVDSQNDHMSTGRFHRSNYDAIIDMMYDTCMASCSTILAMLQRLQSAPTGSVGECPPWLQWIC